MAIVLIDTAGAQDANTYCSLDDANEYFENIRLHDAGWTTAAEEDRNSALAWATMLLDQMCNWHGRIASDTQALRWPRNYVRTPDGKLISSLIIPDWLKLATAEFAFFLLIEDRTVEAGRDAAGISALTVGPISLKFSPESQREKVVMAPSVWAMVRFYCTRYGKNKTLVRV
jgi:hypothetical protein